MSVPPKIAPFGFSDHAVNFEESVSVNCLIYLGDLPMDISWLFNGQPINAYTGVTIVKGGKKISLLSIDSVHGGHAGNYTCIAKNEADTTSYTAELVVNGIKINFLVSYISYFNYAYSCLNAYKIFKNISKIHTVIHNTTHWDKNP